MKRTIAAVIAGIALGTTGTGIAAVQAGYWKHGGSGYTCEGVTRGVICNSGGYKVGVAGEWVFVQQHKQLFTCRKWSNFVTCVQGTP